MNKEEDKNLLQWCLNYIKKQPESDEKEALLNRLEAQSKGGGFDIGSKDGDMKMLLCVTKWEKPYLTDQKKYKMLDEDETQYKVKTDYYNKEKWIDKKHFLVIKTQ